MATNKDYLISRKFIYGLEFIRSEMELKMHEAKIKNPKFDETDIKQKIAAVSETQLYLHELYEELERIKKENLSLQFLNKKLLTDKIYNETKQPH
ncbi:hypothetical protein UFOVP916_4 [uncultured Caudovirales phage]|uniref:Uncharacterized protein n=1 Tax=uncultured Caudovirales phage TaxID=2100421 RepID=A0A6J5STN8_9CAUD|nr:hypothetical protein UFOVP827_25 [uncultured Caudovirales phage]CAB4171416.1 hypothetical protein UFOVP916_4 [uncultured Caudovirales phage]CAB4177355.1 hypothetical protein UFOVP1001_28 [uncultured Caudovirales phage]CAB4199472.1 hypothetical protein UFOVP1338_48 [uncultured Caudovirales phage]CAB4213497.1 hypothetical protein UFOVP1447_43 [uncultured Caudovirales phage]